MLTAEVVITDQIDTIVIETGTFRMKAMGFGGTVIFA